MRTAATPLGIDESTSVARRVNVGATLLSFVSALGIVVVNATWHWVFVERTCEPRLGPLPELCTTRRLLADDEWRAPLIWLLLAVWAVSGAVGWKTWRRGQLVRTGPQRPYLERGLLARVSVGRRMAVLLPGLISASTFWAVRPRTIDRVTSPYGDPASCQVGEVCEYGIAVVQQTVRAGPGLSVWSQSFAWLLVAATLCWWLYAAIAETLARRFGEESLWREALRRRRDVAPTYPVEQQRGNRY